MESYKRDGQVFQKLSGGGFAMIGFFDQGFSDVAAVETRTAILSSVGFPLQVLQPGYLRFAGMKLPATEGPKNLSHNKRRNRN